MAANSINKETEEFTVIFSFSEDKLKIFASAKPKPSKFIEVQKVKDFFYKEFPNALFHEDVIVEIGEALSKGHEVSERRIAKGIPAEDGVDGKLLLLVKPYTEKQEEVSEDKGVSQLYNRHLFDNINLNTVVARIYHPKIGKDGKDAYGKTIPSKVGKPFKIQSDKTLLVKSNNETGFDELLSQAEGFLINDSGKYCVKSELSISGNLDFQYGHLDFIGSIKVSGDITPGFTVKAKKGIIVGGTIRESNLVVPEGDIAIKGFAFGGNNSKIICSGKFTGSVIQNLSVETHGDIIVLKEASDCQLQSERCVFVEQGTLLGGTAYVAEGLQAKKIGNDAGKTTSIFLCSGVETRTEYRKIVAQIEEHEKAMELMKLHLGPLALNPSRIQLLKDPYKTKMKDLHFKYEQVLKSKISLENKQKTMLENVQPVDGLRVNILSIMYPGTVVKTSETEWICNEIINGPKSLVYNIDNKSFSLKELEPLKIMESKDGRK